MGKKKRSKKKSTKKKEPTEDAENIRTIFKGPNQNVASLLVNRKIRDRIKKGAEELDIRMFDFTQAIVIAGLDAVDGLE